MRAFLPESVMRVLRLRWPLCIAVLLAGACWAGDDTTGPKGPSPNSFAPRSHGYRRVYGAPIQSPIVGRKAASKRKSGAKTGVGRKSLHTQKQNDLDDPM